jgi:hypothetical protein
VTSPRRICEISPTPGVKWGRDPWAGAVRGSVALIHDMRYGGRAVVEMNRNDANLLLWANCVRINFGQVLDW